MSWIGSGVSSSLRLLPEEDTDFYHKRGFVFEKLRTEGVRLFAMFEFVFTKTGHGNGSVLIEPWVNSSLPAWYVHFCRLNPASRWCLLTLSTSTLVSAH